MRSAGFVALICVLVAPACSTDKPVAPPPATSPTVSVTSDVPNALGQTGEFEWLLQFGTAVGDSAWDVRADEDGNVYVAGETGAAFPGQAFAGGLLDAFVRKYDAEGHELWTRQFGTAGNDRAFAIFTFGAHVYVGGLTNGAFAGQVNTGGADAFLRKFDANGNEQWTRQFGTARFDEVEGIFVDVTGVYVSGDVFGALPGQTHAGMFDVFVRKYDFDGNELWTHQFGSAGADFARRISGDNSGIYVAGQVDGQLPGQTHFGTRDAFVRKYAPDGSEVWTRQFGTGAVDNATGVATHRTALYVLGSTFAALPGQTHAGLSDAFVRKYGADGTELWTRQFGTTENDIARAVSVRDGVVHVSGVTRGALPGQFNEGERDVFIRAYTSTGHELWTRQFGSVLLDDNWGLSDGPSGLYVAGIAGGALPGLESQGAADAFIGKVVLELAVEIDIEPGGDPNSLRLGPGNLPVAILSSTTFDATTVDPRSVVLAGARVTLRAQGTPMASAEDVDGDGRDDLVVHIDKAALELTAADVIAELTGRTFGGRVVFGVDEVRIIG